MTQPLCSLAMGICLAVQATVAAAPELIGHALVPGLTVDELPLSLPNANNLRFAPDGSLTVLGYDGRVWRVTDSNGDGLEDSAVAWWDRNTLTVPVGMCWSTAGLLVSSSGKISLLRDADGDGRADSEKILAQGWGGKDETSGNVDATGVTIGPDGHIYFALLTANYANPYRVKKVSALSETERKWWLARQPAGTSLPGADSEVSLYDPTGERGTIQRLDPRTGQRETWATGLRVVYQLTFNASGELFATDQEGETWCPNGNPLDELNHVVRGGNYGFPPRHDRWLPSVINQVPAVAFGPQHQSACGFVFNEPRTAAPNPKPASEPATELPTAVVIAQGRFGPESWSGHAFVAGESRGKIWRAPLTRDVDGNYRGTAPPIFRMSLLITDVTISPRGDLYFCGHSGLPDWGTGPNGKGRIFRLRFTDPLAPQPGELRPSTDGQRLEVTFDHPLDPQITLHPESIQWEAGPFVRAADRLETLKPPYATVRAQEVAPRERGRAVAVGLSPDLRTLSVTLSRPIRRDWSHALTIPGVRSRTDGAASYQVELEWVSPTTPAPPQADASSSGLKPEPVGDFETGRGWYEKLQCATCHRLRGEGTGHGPELDNLGSRDLAGLLTDLREPSARINPDYVGYDVTLRDGTQLTGLVRPHGNTHLKITTVTGVITEVAPTEVREMRPSAQSLMPTGLLDQVPEADVTALLTFLRHGPPARELSTLKHGVIPATATPATNPLRLVLVAAKQDHGPGQHDYPRWQTNWLAWWSAPGLRGEAAWEWPSPAQWTSADVVVFYTWNHDWSTARRAELATFQARGGGVVLLHSACIADREAERLVPHFGFAAQPDRTGYRHMPLKLRFRSDEPLTAGLPPALEFLDEPYWPLLGDPASVKVLAEAEVDGAERPLIWTFEPVGGGRVFGSILGHYTWTLNDPVFRELIRRGTAWAGRRDPASLPVPP